MHHRVRKIRNVRRWRRFTTSIPPSLERKNRSIQAFRAEQDAGGWRLIEPDRDHCHAAQGLYFSRPSCSLGPGANSVTTRLQTSDFADCVPVKPPLT